MTDASPSAAPLPPPAAAAPDAPKSRRPDRAAMPAAAWLAAMLVLALILVGTAPYWAPPLLPLLPWGARQTQSQQAQVQTAKRLAAIEQQLAGVLALNGRVAALENKPAPDASAAVAPLTAQVQQLGTRLGEVEQQLSQLAHDQAENGESPQRVLMVALASLGNALAGSRPFAAELASVEALSQSRNGWAAALQSLEAPAKTGLPSTAVLAQRFSSDVAPAILRAEAVGPGTHESLGAAMLARLRGLVVIRRVDGSGAGTSPTDQAVAMAQAALDKNDLAGAVKALAAVTGAPAAAAQPWLADAQQRLNAEEAVAKLSRNLAGDLAAGARGG